MGSSALCSIGAGDGRRGRTIDTRTSTLFFDPFPPSEAITPRDNTEFPSELRRIILGALHEGRITAGTRLPSIRELASRAGTTIYAAGRAYKMLEAEGIVRKRDRSGVYVASFEHDLEDPLPETAQWLGRVLKESYEHEVKLPTLPTLIHRWTRTATIRCACVESSEDYRYALCEEIRDHFGLDALAVSIPESASATQDSWKAEIAGMQPPVDLIITTPFHAVQLRPLAAGLGAPLLVATLSPTSASLTAEFLATRGSLTVVCLETAFGDRVATSLGPAARQRVRVVEADRVREIDCIDRKEPILLTRAARARLSGEEFRLLVARYPSFSADFAARLAERILQVNLKMLRSSSAH